MDPKPQNGPQKANLRERRRRTGMRSGYLARILAATSLRFSVATKSAYARQSGCDWRKQK